VQSDKFSVNYVNHKFLESGHTFLPNNQDFGLVEKNKRFNKDIFVPADWIKVIASAKKHKPFVVTELKTDKIVSLKPLEQRAVNRKKLHMGTRCHLHTANSMVTECVDAVKGDLEIHGVECTKLESF